MTAIQPKGKEKNIPIKNPKSYSQLAFWQAYIANPGINQRRTRVYGAKSPFHSPAKSPDTFTFILIEAAFAKNGIEIASNAKNEINTAFFIKFKREIF